MGAIYVCASNIRAIMFFISSVGTPKPTHTHTHTDVCYRVCARVRVRVFACARLFASLHTGGWRWPRRRWRRAAASTGHRPPCWLVCERRAVRLAPSTRSRSRNSVARCTAIFPYECSHTPGSHAGRAKRPPLFSIFWKTHKWRSTGARIWGRRRTVGGSHVNHCVRLNKCGRRFFLGSMWHVCAFGVYVRTDGHTR